MTKFKTGLVAFILTMMASLSAFAFYSGNTYNYGGDDYAVSVMNHLWKVGEPIDAPGNSIHGQTLSWANYGTQLSNVSVNTGVGGNSQVGAVQVDVWWKVTETADQTFNWTYYDRLFGEIKRKNLQIVPIFSWHQCGLGAGDECNYSLPTWVSSTGNDAERGFTRSGLGTNREYLAFWWDGRNGFNGYPAQTDNATCTYNTSTCKYGQHTTLGSLGGAYKQYREWMQAFKDRYTNNGIQCYNQSGTTYTCKQLGDSFRKVYPGMGPSGELRYPSFSTPFPGYPDRGTMPVGSVEAKRSFEKWVYNKISTNIATINTRYNTNWAWGNGSFNTEHGLDWVLQNDGVDGHPTQNLAVDTLNWYQDLLEEHMKKIVFMAREVGIHNIGRDAKGSRLGVKFAGIHWRYYPENGMTHQAEKMTGYYKYSELFDVVRSLDIDSTLTALELPNNNNPYDNSGAQDLVGYFWNEAYARQTPHFGENALAYGGDQTKYDRTHSHLWLNSDRRYAGFTLLRINHIVSNGFSGQPAAGSYLTNDWDKFKWFLRPKQTVAVGVKFICNNGTTNSGENIFIKGSITALGSNVDANAKKLYPANYPQWDGTVYRVPSATAFTWQCLKKNAAGSVLSYGPVNNATSATGSGLTTVTGSM